MYGRRYSLLIGRSYGIQQTFTPDVPGIDSQEFLGFRYTGTLPGSPLLEQGGFAERYLPSSSKEAVYKRRTPEEIAAIQSAILAGFVEFDLDSYINLYYTDPTLFEESAGFLQFDNIEITDHHIEFDIEKIGGNSTDGNECKLVVYNLSDTEADFISGLASTQNFAQFSAGYADEGLKMLIRGNIEVVEDKLDGTDRRTELLIKDGSKFVQNQMSVRTYRKGTPVRKIINDIIQDVALPKGSIELPEESLTIKKPLIVHGRSVEQLKRVLDVFGYSVNIQDLYINTFKRALDEEAQRAIDEATSNVSANAVDVDRVVSVRVQAPAGYIYDVRLISPTSGLLAIPTKISDSSGMSTQEVANEPTSGIRFKHLLSGELSPNSYVRLETDQFRGNYRIIKVTHSGSLEGDRWETEVEAEQIVWEAKKPSESYQNPVGDNTGLFGGERLTQSEDELARQQRLKDIGLYREGGYGE